MQATITIPYAIADFAEMRERGFYYVDKTAYIEKLENYKAPVFLRPRRFGKSLLVSTLAHYYDRTLAGRFEELFGGTMRYAPVYERYVEERKLEALVQNYFEQYLGQFPAQVFDKINENFIRCSFFELVSRYLSGCYTFAIEQNNSRGRADFEMTGIPGTDFYTDDRLVEFKYYKAAEAEKMLAVDAPLPEHIEQVHGYAQDTLQKFPNYKVRTYVAYICANRGWKCWEVTNS